MHKALFLLMISVGSVRPQETECPKDHNTHLLLRHESACTMFYQCNFGAKILKTCGPGTAFDPALQVCTWPNPTICPQQDSATTKGEPEKSDSPKPSTGPEIASTDSTPTTVSASKSPDATTVLTDSTTPSADLETASTEPAATTESATKSTDATSVLTDSSTPSANLETAPTDSANKSTDATIASTDSTKPSSDVESTSPDSAKPSAETSTESRNVTPVDPAAEPAATPTAETNTKDT